MMNDDDDHDDDDDDDDFVERLEILYSESAGEAVFPSVCFFPFLLEILRY